MPLHDWPRVASGIYHDFHQVWTIAIRNALNSGILPDGYFAMADQRVGGPEPDVVALRTRGRPDTPGGLAVTEARPRLRSSARSQAEAVRYARKANRIAIHQGMGRVVAMIEVVSPGNKSSQRAVGAFVAKAVEFLSNGIHFLLIDPFPPTTSDPAGLAPTIWREFTDEPFPEQPAGKPMAVAAFDAGEDLTVYAEGLGVGDAWPETPLFLEPGWYVNVPLEGTYEASWALTPAPIRALVDAGGGVSTGG
jgi:hypothetical protein